MRRLFPEKTTRWLLPVVLILFMLQVLTLPWVLGLTYPGRNETPDHVLTYTKGSLTWDSATNIGENGAAELHLFDAIYNNTKSEDGANIVAPGTDGFHIVRLKNGITDSVNYTAVLYRISTSESLPIEASLTGQFTDTDTYPLPDGVSADQVVRAVSGTVQGGEILDFDISWLWAFHDSSQQDLTDTLLGTQEDADTVTVGLYITVEDNNSCVEPSLPQTGDRSHLGIYLTLLVISFVVLILLLWERRREKKCAQ